MNRLDKGGPEGKNRSRTVSQARKSRTREFCSSPTKSRMNFWVVKASGLMAALVGAVWNELMFYIQIYSQFQRTFLSLPWVLQDRVKRVFRSCVSRLCQGSWLPLLSVSAGITAVGVMVFFFPDGLVKLEGEALELLSVADLLRVQGQLEAQGKMTDELRACTDLALQEFMREPPSVQDNAQMLIQCQGTMLEFKSGDGENEIYVHYHNWEPLYNMKEPTMDVYLARMRSHPEQLSVENLLRVQTKLEAWGKLTSELRDCFIHAEEKFQQEPLYVQQNAKMLIQSGGTTLVFLSGTGECEISVFYQNRELQYHVKETTMEVYLARLRSNPEQLNVENLLRVQTKLEAWGKMTNELRDCFIHAQDKFQQEPVYVQQNAKMLIQGSGRILEFLSGTGECEISVFYHNRELQYHVKETTVEVYLARLHSHPEQLSVENLLRIQTKLEAWGKMTSELRDCFIHAQEKFQQEPLYVQQNTKMLIQSSETALVFLSGTGECEISVFYRNRELQYHVKETTMDVYLARMRFHPEQLSMENLLRVQTKLEAWGQMTSELRDCFIHAQEKFQQEPVYVQQNTKMLIQSSETALVFLSGTGECEISVFYQNRELQYHVKETTMEVYLARLHSYPEQLSMENLLRVQTKLEAWGKMTSELRDCFIHAQDKFKQEPLYVQQNTKMLIQRGGVALVFLSGTGECEISVFYQNRELQYHVKETTVEVYLARLHSNPEQLSVENLLRVQTKLESGGKMTEILRRCFELTLEKFPKEPSCLQDNTRLVISAEGTELVFVSGWGENEINVYHDNWGLLQYVVIVPGWVTWIARNILIIGFMVLLVIILNIVPFRITRQPHSNLLALGNHSR